jgi:hypothetical protein
MSETSPNLDLPLIMPAQAQKHVTVNEALMRLDALVQARAESATIALQPAAPTDGALWVLPAGATGIEWALMAPGNLALYRDGVWSEIAPRIGWRLYVVDTKSELVFGGDAWRPASDQEVLAETPNRARTRAVLLEETVDTLTGSEVISTLSIPARSIVFCVSVRTIEAISGASSFDCGIEGETSKFGGSLGVSAGAVNIGVVGPTAYYSDTPIRLTANGGDFTGGCVRLVIHAWQPDAPQG